VIVLRVNDRTQMLFDVDDDEPYVHRPSKSARRNVCNQYAQDLGEKYKVALRSGVDEVMQALAMELSRSLGKAGVAGDEALLTLLTHAPEFAQATLRRQQVDALIAARQEIMQRRVSMIDLALKSSGRAARRRS
jgi:hypothetical protein